MTGLRRAAVLAGIAASLALALVPTAQADTRRTLAPTASAWYQPDPTCPSPAGCLAGTTLPLPVAPPVAAIPLSPYPEGTLHVAASGSTESARSYLALPFAALDGEVSSARLTIPLDTAPTSGSALPETANVLVCPYFGVVSDVDGTLLPPPETLCGSAVRATYVATPAPHLEADLGPLATVLPAADGLALLPDLTVPGAWHVAFSAHDRPEAAGTTAPASVLLQLAAATAASPVAAPAQTTAAPGAVPAPPVDLGLAPLGGSAPAPALGVVSGVVPDVAAPAAAPALAGPAPQQIATRPVAAQLLRRPLGAAYPVLWLLPVGLLVVVPWVGRLLLADLPTSRRPQPVARPRT